MAVNDEIGEIGKEMVVACKFVKVTKNSSQDNRLSARGSNQATSKCKVSSFETCLMQSRLKFHCVFPADGGGVLVLLIS